MPIMVPTIFLVSVFMVFAMASIVGIAMLPAIHTVGDRKVMVSVRTDISIPIGGGGISDVSLRVEGFTPVRAR